MHNNTTYVALSYKWGSKKRYLSCLHNIKDHYKAIPLHALPKTFIDAIDVSHQLGFSNLWIDALAIIQDCPTEKSQEVDRMGDIFRSATLTLFAQAADDADAGLAVHRDPRHFKPCKFNFSIMIEDRSVSTTVYANVRTDVGFHQKTSPLQQRGWVLQEEVSSVRALSFGKQEIRWDCHCDKASEARPEAYSSLIPGQLEDEHKSVTEWRPDDSGFRRCLLQFQNRYTPWLGTDHPFIAWYILVQVYSGRSLTYTSDVLPALAGLARIMARTQGVQYVNGLWKEDIIPGLLGSVDPGAASTSIVGVQPSAAAITAPSWTWISQWGSRIIYKLPLWSSRQEEPLVEVTWAKDLGGCVSRSSSQLILTAVIPDKPLPERQPSLYQEITAKALTLTGFVSTGILKSNFEDSLSTGIAKHIPRRGPWARSVINAQNRYPLGLLWSDSDADRRVTEITVILCAATKPRLSLDRHEFSLALIPTDCANEYKRIGLLEHRVVSDGKYDVEERTPEELWEGRCWKTITVV
jgi:hypothetical protein